MLFAYCHSSLQGFWRLLHSQGEVIRGKKAGKVSSRRRKRRRRAAEKKEQKE